MFTPDKIAPCGLDCTLCARAQDPQHPCPGCNGPDENKPEFCRERCGIIRCPERREKGYRFCDACRDYPCADVMEKENRYTSQYPLRESPVQNLWDIRTMGMDAFLEKGRERWSCRVCKGPVCVHTGICGKCGRKYGRLCE